MGIKREKGVVVRTGRDLQDFVLHGTPTHVACFQYARVLRSQMILKLSEHGFYDIDKLLRLILFRSISSIESYELVYRVDALNGETPVVKTLHGGPHAVNRCCVHAMTAFALNHLRERVVPEPTDFFRALRQANWQWYEAHRIRDYEIGRTALRDLQRIAARMGPRYRQLYNTVEAAVFPSRVAEQTFPEDGIDFKVLEGLCRHESPEKEAETLRGFDRGI